MSDLIAELRVLAEYIDAAGEAADALEAQALRIAELEAALKIKYANGHPVTTVMGINSKLTDALDSRDARIAELEAAFEKAANDMRPMLRSMISRGEAAEIVRRAARAALEKKND